MALNKSKSLTKSFMTMVTIACVLVIIFSAFGVKDLIKYNSERLALSKSKLDVLENLNRLDAIEHRQMQAYLENKQIPAHLNYSTQFLTEIDNTKQQLSLSYTSHISAIESAWQALITSIKLNPSLLETVKANNQQLLSHLSVLKQTALSLLDEEQQKIDENIQFATIFTLACSFLGMFLGAFIVMRQANHISDSLRGLGQGMAMAAVGDLTNRIEVKGCSEVEALSEGFNYMMSELERQALEVLASEQGLVAVMDSAPDAIITTDLHGTIFSWNRACERMFAYYLEDISGHKFQTILDPNQQADFNNILSDIRNSDTSNLIEPEGPWELSVRRKDGLHIPIEFSIRTMTVDGEKKLVIVGRDITERKAAEEKMAFLTQHDILTHLPNRTLIRERLIQTMNRADEEERLVGVISLGIDHFTDINDNLGHTLADGLLVALVDRVNDLLSRRDQFGRIGGDEFCIILDSMCHVDETSQLAEQIIIRLAQPFKLGGHEVYITASLGISIYPFDDETPEVLLKHASAAMYRCKRNESQSFLFYSEKMNSINSDRVKLTTELKHALEDNQFLLYYQPQYSLISNELIGVEALLRWQHPEFGLLGPETFINILEESGLIVPLGEWMLSEVSQKIVLWNQGRKKPCRVSLNLSSRQFKDKSFYSKLHAQIEQLKTNLYKEGIIENKNADIQQYLEFELTERLLMENTDVSREMLYSLKELGIKLSVDDFGTGYSSLSYLQQFPIDTLKIDQSFVNDIGRSQGAELIVHAIIDLAHNLQLNVIGEGVESKQQLDFLREKGCDEVQGHYFSKALAEENFQDLLASILPTMEEVS